MGNSSNLFAYAMIVRTGKKAGMQMTIIRWRMAAMELLLELPLVAGRCLKTNGGGVVRQQRALSCLPCSGKLKLKH